MDSIKCLTLTCYLEQTLIENEGLIMDVSRCEPGDTDCMDRAFAKLSQSPEKDKPGTLSALANSINKIFLFANHEIAGISLMEGEEETSSIPELSAEQYQAYAAKFKEEVDKALVEPRSTWIESQKKYFDKIVKEAANVISLNTSLASASTSKEFFAILGKLKSAAGDEMKDLDIGKLQSSFSDIGKKIKDDEESMKKIKKSFEDEKIEETEENLTKKLEEITMSSFKGTFLQELKSALTDYYEEVHTTITGGVTPEQKKLLVNDPLGKEYLSTIDLYEKKLKDALSNLK